MREFEVEIREILVKKIRIKAKDQQVAYKIVKSAYDKCEIVLSADDFCDAEFSVTSIDESKTKI